MQISIKDVSPKELGELLEKFRAPTSTPTDNGLVELRQQVQQLTIAIEKTQRQQVEIQYPAPRPQLQLPPASTQLYLPESPARLQTQPTPLPATDIQEPGIRLPWWASAPVVNAVSAGLILGTIALIAWRNWPTTTAPKIGPSPNSSNLLKVPTPPPGGKGMIPPAPTLPAIPQLNP
jgi:hypothetical protein